VALKTTCDSNRGMFYCYATYYRCGIGDFTLEESALVPFPLAASITSDRTASRHPRIYINREVEPTSSGREI